MLARLLLSLAVVVIGTAGARAETQVERGAYLANLMTCHNCHTPIGPKGHDFARALSGGVQTFDTPEYTVKGSNITPDPETGIGKWNAADLKRLLRKGVRPNGVPIASVMPTGFYGIMTEADLDALVAYVRSVPAIRNEVQAPVYSKPFKRQIFPAALKPMPERQFGDKVKRGLYLATIAHCMECHSPVADGRPDFRRAMGKGGQEFKGPWGVSVSRNITSHKQKGLGAWTDEEIRRAITQGLSRDGSKLKPPMAFGLYAKLNDGDLGAIVAYLRTVPAKE